MLALYHAGRRSEALNASRATWAYAWACAARPAVAPALESDPGTRHPAPGAPAFGNHPGRVMRRFPRDGDRGR